MRLCSMPANAGMSGKLIDSDDITYSVAILNGWKEIAERKALEAISGALEHGIAFLERRLSGP
jgi:hypothetical protein